MKSGASIDAPNQNRRRWCTGHNAKATTVTFFFEKKEEQAQPQKWLQPARRAQTICRGSVRLQKND